MNLVRIAENHGANRDGSLELIPTTVEVPAAVVQRSTSRNSVSPSRRMQETMTMPISAYRVHFSIVDKKNRSWLRGSTTRTIRWVFGRPNQSAMLEGKVGSECRGNEHQIELIWSKHSSKRRIRCNQILIATVTHKSQRTTVGSDVAANTLYSWKLHSGELLHIRAAAAPNDVNTDTNQQYQLFIDGVNFFDLARVSELGRLRRIRHDNASSPRQNCTIDTSSIQEEQQQQNQQQQNQHAILPTAIPSMTDENVEEVDLVSSNSLGFRLSMAGFRSSTSLDKDNAIEDELHSALYSSTIETLRSRITTFLPQTEEMVSRAIINAFFGDVSSSDTFSLCSWDEISPMQVEVDAVCEAYRWKLKHAHCFSQSVAPGAVYDDDATLRCMQKIVDDVFVRVRGEELDALEAARVVHSVGAVLELGFASDIASDCVIFDRLEQGTTEADLRRFLSPFGEVDFVVFARSTPSFSLCRFRHEASVASLAKTLHWDTATAAFGMEKPSLYVLSHNRYNTNDDVLCRRMQSVDCEHLLDDSGDDSTCVALPPTESLALDGSLGSDGGSFVVYNLDTTQFTWAPETERSTA